MRGVRSLADLYRREIEPALVPLEAERRRLVRRALTTGTLLIALATTSVVMLSSFSAMPLPRSIGTTSALLCILGGLLWLGWTRSEYERYRSEFKGRVIAPLMHLGGRAMRYSPEEGIRESTFRSSHIFSRAPDRYAAEDLISGRHVHTSYAVSEVHAQYKTTTTDQEGRVTTTWHDLFRGIFFVADFNKHFSGSTVVLPDTAERLLGHVGTSLQTLGAVLDGRDGRVVHLEDPEFEREFVVRSTDEIEARYILSTSLMRRILELRTRFDGLALAFHRSRIYLAIPSRRDIFEAPSVLRPLDRAITMDAVGRHLADIESFLAIIDELDLNTRIWSKQPGAATG